MTDPLGTVIFSVSATRYAAVSFPDCDCVRISPARYTPSIRVLLAGPGGRSEVMAVPVTTLEPRGEKDLELARALMHRKVDEVIDGLALETKVTQEATP